MHRFKSVIDLGHLYVPWKCWIKTFFMSSRAWIVFSGRLSIHMREVPSNMGKEMHGIVSVVIIKANHTDII